MGRMSDARKRAQKKGAGAPPARPEPPPATPEVSPVREWASRDETLVFPAEPATEETVPSRKIALPSSGLAEEILARADAAAVAPVAIVSTSAPEPAAPRPADDTLSRAHNISFFAAPAREERKAVEATEHLVTFFLAQEEYGVDVRLVQEIIRVTDITQVPRAPEFIKGVINLRGRIIPVVDLKRRLNLGEVEPTRLARIVVVKVRDRLTGLLVDGASQVLRVPVSAIEAAPEEVVEIDANYIRGVAKLEKRLIILVDLQKILAPEVREGAAQASPP
jgi:purine-binding chemotaxis protein CheW